MDHIGLLMCRNEIDCLSEVLDQHCKYFDQIVAQDGSTDGGQDIIKACPNVVKHFHDDDILRPGERFSDGHRNHALQWILQRYDPATTWVTLLHADEIWHDDPIQMAEWAAHDGATFILWGEFRFFMHTTDEPSFDPCKPLSQRLSWWQGPFYERRSFWLAAHQIYKEGEDHQTLPSGPLSARRWHHVPRYKHYPYRSPAQCAQAYQDKVATRYWQPDRAWLGEGRYFVDCPPAPVNSPIAAWQNVQRFDGTLPDAEAFLPKWFMGNGRST